MALREFSRHDDLTFPEGTPDIRNWEVRTRADGDRVGEVDDVLVDDGGSCRYLDVEVDALDRHVLLPSGQAQVDRSERVVWVPGMSREGFADVPAYSHDTAAITPDYERRLSTAYTSAYAHDYYYDRPDYAAAWAGGTAAGTAARTEDDTRTGTGARRASGTLGRLDELDDYEVADHEHDPRGWSVTARDGTRVGRVDHLIGDTGAMKVRYLTVDLDHEAAGGERRVLVPAGHARLEPESRSVRVDALAPDRLGAAPAYTGAGIDRDYETRLTGWYDEAYTGEGRYGHPRYRDDRLWNAGTGVER